MTSPPRSQSLTGSVVHCSAQGRSCRLELPDGSEQTVNLSRVPYAVLEEEAAGANGRDESLSQSELDEEVSESGDEGSDASDGSDGSEGAPVLDAFDAPAGRAVEAFLSACRPAAFLRPGESASSEAREALQALHRLAQAHSRRSGARKGLGKAGLLGLCTEGFDPEQIWLQLEGALEPQLKQASRLLRAAGEEPQLLSPEDEAALDELLGLGSDGDEGEDSDGDAGESDDASDGDEKDDGRMLRTKRASAKDPASASDSEGASDASYSENSDSEPESLPGSSPGTSAKSSRGARAQVEDDHFKLDEMEAFVRQAERQERREQGEAVSGSDSDGEDLELALDAAMAPGRGGEEEDLDILAGGDAEEGAAARYEDFFGPRRGGRGSGQKRARRAAEPVAEARKRARSVLQEDADSEEEDEDGAGSRSEEEELQGESEAEDFDGSSKNARTSARDAPGAASEPQTAHARAQARLAARIQSLEQEALAAKDWFMRGEVTASQRPADSALEIELDFESGARPPPAATEESTASLEERIRARVAEGRWDDVARAAAEKPARRREQVALDDGKPQQGLGDVYEADYLKSVRGVTDDKDEEIRAAVRREFKVLCSKLDALSHADYRPRPSIEQVAVKADVPAILMEESAPQALSLASMRAPEEVAAASQQDPRAESELGKEDRRRRRAQVKRAAKKRRAADAAEKAAGAGGTLGRKSERGERDAAGARKKGKKGAAAAQQERVKYAKSASVFSHIQQGREGAKAGAPASKPASGKTGTQLRL